MTETPTGQNQPGKNKSIDDEVREMYKEAQKKGLPIGLIISLPEGYAAGVTAKYALPKHKTPEEYESVVAHLLFGALDILIEYVKPKELKQWVNELYTRYELDNPEKFLYDDDKPDQPKPAA